jgi:prolipoprotein diacylglyceryltransferase
LSALKANAAVFCAFPFAWILGRTGCFLGRDHPGRFTTSWLGVEYPDRVRYDLGLIEALFAAALIAALPLTRRWPAGLRTGSLLSAYGLFRFLLDRLHTDPPRYSGWTVDEISAVLAETVFHRKRDLCSTNRIGTPQRRGKRYSEGSSNSMPQETSPRSNR